MVRLWSGERNGLVGPPEDAVGVNRNVDCCRCFPWNPDDVTRSFKDKRYVCNWLLPRVAGKQTLFFWRVRCGVLVTTRDTDQCNNLYSACKQWRSTWPERTNTSGERSVSYWGDTNEGEETTHARRAVWASIATPYTWHAAAPHRAEDTRLSLTQQQLSNVCEFVAIDCAQSPSRCDAISSTWTRCRHNVAERKCVACSWQRDLLQVRSTRRQLPLQCLFWLHRGDANHSSSSSTN